MPKFRKKPVVIEAEQFVGDHRQFPLIVQSCKCRMFEKAVCSDCGKYFIQTREGRMEVSVGDWIVRGVQGEFYPCKPDIFAATYEEVA